MFELLKKRIKNEKGLSLVELLAVIVILAIVAAIAIPAIGNIIENSRYNGVKSDAINVINAANMYYTDNPDVKTDVSVETLQNEKYLDSPGKILPAATVTATVPRALKATVADVISTHDVIFDGATATVETINKDKQKGSKIDKDYTVGTTK